MEFDLVRYTGEIVEFLSAKTLEEIDYGILDLSDIEDVELKEVLYFFEELLTLELKVNYYENFTGVFRVHCDGEGFCYREFGYEIEAGSLRDLKELVLAENRIWYVFDDFLARRLWMQ
jgi:hypothetical protein